MASNYNAPTFNTTGGKCFIVELAPPFERLEFQFMPENMKYTRSGTFATIAPVGRNNDVLHYTGGNDDLSFDLDFYSDEKGYQDVLRKCNFIRSLVMSDGGYGPARNVKVVMGNLFRKDIWVVKDVDIAYDYFAIENFLPRRASIKIKLQLDPKKNRRIKDVRG
jgi:hypothetical protein